MVKFKKNNRIEKIFLSHHYNWQKVIYNDEYRKLLSV
jgi:hypothetical protein